VGAAQRSAGEFLAHCGWREIYMGKLIASLIPGYVTTVVGFGVYALLVTSSSARCWRMVLPDAVMVAAHPVGTAAFWRSHCPRCDCRHSQGTAAARQAAGLVTFPLIISRTAVDWRLVGLG
jgi:hypothetical protein